MTLLYVSQYVKLLRTTVCGSTRDLNVTSHEYTALILRRYAGYKDHFGTIDLTADGLFFTAEADTALPFEKQLLRTKV